MVQRNGRPDSLTQASTDTQASADAQASTDAQACADTTKLEVWNVLRCRVCGRRMRSKCAIYVYNRSRQGWLHGYGRLLAKEWGMFSLL